MEDRYRNQIHQAVQILRRGGIVAFPTETYYGLAVDPYNVKALSRLYGVKQRDEAKPLLVLVENLDQCRGLVDGELPASFVRLAQLFWPGPLTLIASAAEGLPLELTGKTETIGMRQSPHPVAGQLVATMQGPITATSANLSGQKAATTAEEVERFFGKSIDFILNGGKTPGKNASTLVKCTSDTVKCLREGVIQFRVILDQLTQNKQP